MLRIEKVLFPTDFSSCAEAAFTHAAYLAGTYGAELHVLNVVPPDEGASNAAGPAAQGIDVYVPHGIDSGDAGPDVQIIYAQEHNAKEAQGILGYADAHDIDLIVMGTHGRQGLDRAFLGSVAEEVVRLASCPVFTVRNGHKKDPKHAIHRILVPIDFSEYGGPALEYGNALATTYDAHIDLLHVVEESEMPVVFGGVKSLAVAAPEVKERCKEVLLEQAQTTLSDGLSFEVHTLIGHSSRDVTDFAQVHHNDLIVIATHGRTGVQRRRLGSVTERVVRMAPCPVFTVKSFGKTLLQPENSPPKADALPF